MRQALRRAFHSASTSFSIAITLSRQKLSSIPLIIRRSAAPLLTVGAAGSLWGAAEAYLPEEKHTVNLFKEAQSSVISVTNLTRVHMSIFRGGFSERNAKQGAGSGFVWDDDGHVITNFHVIKDASQVRLTLPDGNQVFVELVGSDTQSDLAVLRVPRSHRQGLKPIPHGDSKNIQVGQKTFAIGYPFGLDLALTSGIVSGLGREMPGNPHIYDLIQTDAAINPGSSGGPLLDSKGRLIGINTAIISKSGGFDGVGYAIPVNSVRKIVRELIKHGRVVRPELGITMANDYVLSQLGAEGVLVLDVAPGSAAYESGLRPTVMKQDYYGGTVTVLGDVVVGINGQVVRNSKDLLRKMDQMNVGDKITVRVANLGNDGKRKRERNVRMMLKEQRGVPGR